MNIKDIAKLSDVSISTVSRVINNSAKVSPEVRKRVEIVIKEMNYRPNSLARELQQKKTNTIGVLMSAEGLDLSSLSESINSIADVLKDNGFNIMLANTRFHHDQEFEFLNIFQEKRVDGVLYFASTFTDKHYDVFKNYPVPIVMIGQQYELLDIPYVIHDDFSAARAATNFLIEKGHKEIGIIGGPIEDEAVGVQRLRGFEAALNIHNIAKNDDYCEIGDFSLTSGYEAMKKIHLNCKLLPTAIFAVTDFMAIGAIRYLVEKGIKVPEQVSVIGFDDVGVSAFYNPPLTTIHSDKKAIGHLAATLLLQILNGQEVTTKKFIASYELVVRESVLDINNRIKS
jgi:LacI family sucrose operon transcriptional repressor